METPRSVPLSAADSAWWRMDRPDNHMAITAVLLFEEPLAFARVEEIFRTRFLRFRRFRQRLRRSRWPLGRLHWEDDPAFRLERHLAPADLPPPAGEAELQALVGDLMSAPLDPAHPLWEFHFVEDYQGGSALVGRIHHCIADGIALIHVLLTLDDIPGNESAAATWWEKSQRRVAAPRRGATGWGRALRPLAWLGAGARLGGLVAAELADLLFMRFDPQTALQGALSARKKAAWSDPVPLDRFIALGRASSATVHDVLAATAAGALREHLRERGRTMRERSVRAVIPANLRTASDGDSLGNRFGLLFLPLPVAFTDPVERLRAVEREMRRLKRSVQPLVIYGLLTVFGHVLRPFLPLVIAFLGKKASLVMTDVPGPRESVTFAGVRLSGLMAWVPQAGRLGVGISLLSYAGEVRVGVAADARILPDPGTLVRACERALVELEARLDTAPAGVP